MRIPCASARSAARRIVGPSASGSENGNPSSTTSAPPATAAAASSGRVRTGHEVDDERLRQRVEHLGEILVAASRQPDENRLGIEVERAGERVRRLERRQDALRGREAVKGCERLRVRCRHVLGPARVAQVRMLGADSRVVEAGRDRVRVEDLTVLVGEDRRAGAVEHARASRARGSRRLPPRLRRAAPLRPRGSRRRARLRSSRRPRTRRPRRASCPSCSSTCSRASRPITLCSSRTIVGYGCGPTQEPIR